MTRESRDLPLALAGAVIGGPVALFFTYSAAALSSAMSFARPEFALAILLAIFSACALGWNALWSALALVSLARFTPSTWRRALMKAANICGTRRARRIMARSVTSCALGATVWGAGLSAAVADTSEGAAATDPASLTWIWEASDSPSYTPTPSSSDMQGQTPGGTDAADPQAHTAPPSAEDPQPQSGKAEHAGTPSTTESASTQSASSTPDAPKAASSAPASAPASVPSATGSTSGASQQHTQPQSWGHTPSQTHSGGSSPARHASEASEASAAAQARHVVLPGDTLWDIARSHLPAGATAQQISERWQQIYALNQDLIGEDPNLIHPGQTLTLPKE